MSGAAEQWLQAPQSMAVGKNYNGDRNFSLGHLLGPFGLFAVVVGSPPLSFFKTMFLCLTALTVPELTL